MHENLPELFVHIPAIRFSTTGTNARLDGPENLIQSTDSTSGSRRRLVAGNWPQPNRGIEHRNFARAIFEALADIIAENHACFYFQERFGPPDAGSHAYPSVFRHGRNLSD